MKVWDNGDKAVLLIGMFCLLYAMWLSRNMVEFSMASSMGFTMILIKLSEIAFGKDGN